MKSFLSIILTLMVMTTLSGQVINYKIKKEDTLLDVLNSFKVNEKELLRYNNKSKISRFWVGDTIRIPLKNTRILDYKVKKGDTIFDLIEKYNAEVETIYAINDKKILNRMWIGDKIKIPVPFSKKVKSKERSKLNFYKIKKGESYYSISKKLNISVNHLQKINNFKKLLINEKIEIPPKNILSLKISKPINEKQMKIKFAIPSAHYKVKNDIYLKSPINGTVIGIREIKGYGKAIFIKNGRNTCILASKGFENFLVSYGYKVKQKKRIATIRKKYILHFFLLKNNKFYKPL